MYTLNKTRHTVTCSNLDHEITDVYKQELTVAQTDIFQSQQLTKYVTIIVILNETAILTSKQMYVYCNLCIAVHFNNIFVSAP